MRRKIVAAVREVKAAGVSQHVRVHRRQSGAPDRGCDEVVHRLPGERLPAFGDEQPRQRVGPRREITPDRAQLVAGDRLLDRETVLQSPHPQARSVEVDLVAAQVDGLAHPHPVPIHHQDEEVIAHAVSACLRRLEEGGDLALGEEIPFPLVPVRGAGRVTLDSSPAGRRCRHHHNPLSARRTG